MSKQPKGTHGQNPRVIVVAKLTVTTIGSYLLYGTAVSSAANGFSYYVNYALPRVAVVVTLVRGHSSASMPAFFRLRAGFLSADLIEKAALTPLVCVEQAHSPPDIPTGELFFYAVIARDSSARQREKPSHTSIAMPHERQAPLVARQFKNGDMTGRNQRLYRWSRPVRTAFLRRPRPLAHNTGSANPKSMAAGLKIFSKKNHQISNEVQRLPAVMARLKPVSTGFRRLDSR